MRRTRVQRSWLPAFVTSITIITLITLQAVLSPSVLGEPVERTQMLYINPDPDAMTWNDTFNLSDRNNSAISNYNQTIVPFMNETGINGTFTGTFMPPMLWEVSDETTFDQFSFFQLVRFKAEWIMSGSSVSWWRMPVMNVSDWDYLTMVIHRVGNPAALTITPDTGVLNPSSRSEMVYREYYFSESRNESWYEQNVTAWERDWRFLWLRVDAPIHADETYLVQFYVWQTKPVPAIHCLFSQTELSDDQILESQFDFGDGIEKMGCDLDISVIHQYGMGHTVGGWEIEATDGKIQFYTRTSEPVDSPDDNITFMMPFLKDISNSSNAQVNISNTNFSWVRSWWVADNGPTDFTIRSFQWGENYNNSIFKVNVTFQNSSNMIWIHDKYSDLDPWAPTTYRDQMFWYGVSDDANGSAVKQVWFRPYHSLQITDGQWINTVISPEYYLDGRLVDPDALKMRTTDHSDPLYWKIIMGIGRLIIDIPLYIWTIGDWILLDILPDLDRNTIRGWFFTGSEWLKSHLQPIFNFLGYIVQAVKFIIEHGSEILAGFFRGLALVIFIPIFGFVILLTNGVKRFMVIIARDGFEPAAVYADNFIRNSISMAKSLPVVHIAKGVSKGIQFLKR